MFDAPLIADAYAAAGPPPAGGGYDPQTIMAVIGGIVSGLVLGLSGLLYGGGKSVRPPVATVETLAKLGDGAQLFLQGPATDIQSKLAVQALMLERLLAMHYETREQIATAMQLTRHDIRNALGEEAIDASRETNEIKLRIDAVQKDLGAVSNTLGRLDEFVRLRLKR